MDAPLVISFGSAAISLTAVAATFYGVRYTNKINVQLQDDRLPFDERRQNREMLRQKGDELYTVLDGFQSEFCAQICD